MREVVAYPLVPQRIDIPIYGLRIVKASPGAIVVFDDGTRFQITALETLPLRQGEPYRAVELNAGTAGELRVRIAQSPKEAEELRASASPLAPVPPAGYILLAENIADTVLRRGPVSTGTRQWNQPPSSFLAAGALATAEAFYVDFMQYLTFNLFDGNGTPAVPLSLRLWWWLPFIPNASIVATDGAGAGWLPDGSLITFAANDRVKGVAVNVVPGWSPIPQGPNGFPLPLLYDAAGNRVIVAPYAGAGFTVQSLGMPGGSAPRLTVVGSLDAP